MLTSVAEGGLGYGIGMGLRGACKVNPKSESERVGACCACSRFWTGLPPAVLATGIRGMNILKLHSL